ncbi:MAG: ferrous iron transport protein A [Lachnospiraceae bacterium]|nr:ferrous iron transport protein A [Lachnospiraceae bacterium]
MGMRKVLWDMEVGERNRIVEIDCNSALRRRLMELGFVKDGVVLCVGESPLKDPKAYEVRGIVVALRGIEGKEIWVEDGYGIDSEINGV